jgi:hypothetical protein
MLYALSTVEVAPIEIPPVRRSLSLNSGETFLDRQINDASLRGSGYVAEYEKKLVDQQNQVESKLSSVEKPVEPPRSESSPVPAAAVPTKSPRSLIHEFAFAVDAAAQLAGASVGSTPASGEAEMEDMPAKLVKKVRRSIQSLLTAEADSDEVDSVEQPTGDVEMEEMPAKPAQLLRRTSQSLLLAAADSENLQSTEDAENEERAVADVNMTQANPSSRRSRSGSPMSFPIMEQRSTEKHGRVLRSQSRERTAVKTDDKKITDNVKTKPVKPASSSIAAASMGATASVGPINNFEKMFPFEESRQGIKFRVPGTAGYFTFDVDDGAMVPVLHPDQPTTPVTKRSYAASGMSDEDEPCSKRHRDRIHLSAPFLVLQDQIPTPASYNVNMLVPIPRNNPFISLVDTSVEIVCRQEAGT